MSFKNSRITILSRYQILKVITALLAALVLWCHHIFLFVIIVVVFLTIIALGVKIPQLRFFGPYVCRGVGVRRCVALTFDDGPDAHSTPALLELLRKEKVEAAFFCVGKRVAAHPDLAARIVQEGHSLENHTYSHSNTTNLFTVARLRGELTQTQAAIQEASGVVPKLFRPPMGLSNPRIFKAARSLGLTVVGWTARGLDTKLTEPKQIVARIVRGLRPGAIILLHDGNIPAQRLLTTVKTLLDTLGTLGYEVVRLDKLLE